MKYSNYYNLILSASKYDNFNEFYLYCGNTNDENNINKYLLIYVYAHEQTCESIRRIAKMTRAEFCREYHLPMRTVEDWDAGRREPPKYLLDALAFAVISDLM